ncbi:hypothetical protein FE904_06950 [Chryseobacterium indologenes]|uniref:DNA methyltransferase n=1 Tax=Chryseobacterium indologenes TaxID=253 RepID=UPI001108E448|nr:DNA methyltransferase [Chryseobacterium indologenes]TLX26584.1 hypothetical protein FE904_06950 [Chryseobacterium indologenes]
MTIFESKLKSVKAIHDTPIGLIHPYWARKPLNVIEAIISEFSKEGDTIADPFMGSGTTLIAALKLNRNAVGSDLSPMATLLVNGIVNSIENADVFEKIIIDAAKDWTEFAFHLYSISTDKCVERENYEVIGDYTNSNFVLKNIDFKVKSYKANLLKGKTEILPYIKYIKKLHNKYKNWPTDFSKIFFTENSRIAVHKGVKAADFFTERNIVFLNYAKDYISKQNLQEDEINLLELFLSSMIPLLRLSDKKAGSQWPYWRPKNSLISRNPIVAIEKRKKAYLNLITWCKIEIIVKNQKHKIFNVPANELFSQYTEQVDLIITDPPYADHAPYMEYSDLHWSIIKNQRTISLWDKEIVKTNAVGRTKDSNEYEMRMYNSFCSIIEGLKENGYLIFFYVDKNLIHWQKIKEAIYDSNCFVEDVISITKQRKSMKTVTTPGKTLDGDLLIVCKKVSDSNRKLQQNTIKNILTQIDDVSYFDRFTSFIREFLKNEITDLKDWQLKDLSKLI